MADWPEDHITSISESRFESMEDGGYEVLNSSTIQLGGNDVSREYFTNPSRDTDTQWDHIGVNYVFHKKILITVFKSIISQMQIIIISLILQN